MGDVYKLVCASAREDPNVVFELDLSYIIIMFIIIITIIIIVIIIIII